MRIIEPNELKAILAAHKLWLNRKVGGTEADLKGADLKGADLTEADLDFSCWPLHCDSLKVKLDQKQKRQLLYHALAIMTPKERGQCITKTGMDFVNEFHRRKDNEVPKLEAK
jgi:hypothetical protein